MASNMIELAKTILAQVELVNSSLSAAARSDPSLDVNKTHTSISADPNAQAARAAATTAAQQLILLLNGPKGILEDVTELDLAALQVIHRYQIANSFPIGTTATYADIASQCGLSENLARRIIRYAMTNGIFAESEPGIVAHTSVSEALAQDPRTRADVAHTVEEQFPAAAHLAESIQKFGDSQEGGESAWALANRSSRPMFVELHDKFPARAQNFGNFMDIWATLNSTDPLLDAINWKSIASDCSPSKPHFVDIGGSKGHVSGALAEAHPEFIFTVQDYGDTIADASSALPPAVHDRVSYQAYDFISAPQPIHGAAVYFFRTILHNWSDKYCVQILRNLVPALRPGARIILNEVCLADSSSVMVERVTRALDMVMMTLFNGQERSRDEFVRILALADPRFEVVDVKLPALNAQGFPDQGVLSVIEVVWKG